MDIFESLENLNVSEECFEDIVGLVEDIVSQAEKNIANAQKKKDEWFRRTQRVIDNKKKDGTLGSDEKFQDKLFDKLATGKYANGVKKAEKLLQAAKRTKRRGEIATEKKELERIQNNKTRTDIHPSVLKKQEQREDDLKKVAGFASTSGYTPDVTKDEEDKVTSSAIATTRAKGAENKNAIGAEKTTSRKFPTAWRTSGMYNDEWGGDYPQYLTRIDKEDGEEVYLEPKSNSKAIKDAISRHKAKREKNK